MNMKPDITVIVPMYNVENYIGKCLKSLTKQTFQNFEILAINDGSKDKSSIIAKEYSKVDARVKVIDKRNGGYGSVLKYAIENLHTKYFLICDPDDWLAQECLSELYNFANKSRLDIAVADRYDVYVGSTKALSQKIKPLKLTEILPNKMYDDVNSIQKFSFFDVSPHAKLFKTDLVKNLNFPKKVSYTDFFLYISALANAKRVGYIDEPLAYYLRDRPGNTATAVKPTIINDYIVVWKATFDEIKMNPDNSILLYRLYLQIRLILSEYNRVIKGKKFKDKYWDEIMNIINIFQNETEKLNNIPNFDNSAVRKVFYSLFMSKFTYKFASKIYVTSKG